MKLSELDYPLPKELIAQKPCRPRDRSRLLVLDRKTGRIQHRRFYNIVDYLNKDDVLVLNNTKVIPCRLIAQRQSGGVADILLVKQDDKNESLWTALVNFNRRLKENETLSLVNNDSIKISLLKRLEEGWQIRITPAIGVSAKGGSPPDGRAGASGGKDLEKLGKMPLPPYIKRSKTKDTYLKQDKINYQTVYAAQPLRARAWSIAAPTAGLHFTRPLISRLIKKGVRIVYITLHVGIGTFKPIKTDNIEDHRMEQEYFEVSPETTRILLEAYRDKKRIIAVGTTTTRVLETIAGQVRMLMVHPWLEKQRVMRASLIRGWTDLFIYPVRSIPPKAGVSSNGVHQPYPFKLVNALITNFHLPRGTPLALVSAFASRNLILNAYQQAMNKKYRFYSYGDSMLIL
ncbi:MAG: tRNA preQ1(34) S-adenosylmethionine ribosyltransferase-isomerase QueA [Planctomycetota bacterium]